MFMVGIQTQPMRKWSTSFYLSEEVHEMLEREAEAANTSRNKIVERAVRELLESSQSEIDPELSATQDQILFDLRDQIAFLRRELERKDTILMALTQRVPEIKPTEESKDAEESQIQAEPRKSLWARLFGGN